MSAITIALTPTNLEVLAAHYELEQEDDLAAQCHAASAGDRNALGWVRYELVTNPVRLAPHLAMSLDYVSK